MRAYDGGARALAAHQETARASFNESAALLQGLADGAGGGAPIHNAGLYYDMGNSYLLAGDTGRAVLNYRRALRLAPLNMDIKKNLGTAREKVGAGSAAEGPGVLGNVTAYIDSVPARARFIAFAGAFVATFVLLLWRLTGMWARATRWMAATTGIIAVVAIASLAVPRALERRDSAVVVAPQVIGRSGPDDVTYEAEPSSPIKGGTEVSIVQERAGWAQVELPGSVRTWTPMSAIERVDRE
jgi:tetratricopeptide (TPR) repeat protein